MAIGEWAADVPADVLDTLGIRYNRFVRAHEVPDEATLRDVLERLVAVAFAAATGAWMKNLSVVADDTECAVAGPSAPRPRRASIAVDGKALRGTRHHTASGRAWHLLAACTGRHGLVLAQVEVDGKSNEVSAFEPLLRPLTLDGTVVTADALHTQRDHARFLVKEKNAHFIFVVKKNQPSLYHQLKQLLWRQVRIGHSEDHHGHGRTERRSIKLVSVRQGLLFPHAVQAIAITRKTRPRHGGRWKSVTVYAITSLAAHHARPEEIAAWIRRHWQIEALHHIRDVTTARTPPRSAPAQAPPSWPRSATSPSVLRLDQHRQGQPESPSRCSPLPRHPRTRNQTERHITRERRSPRPKTR
ncbi:ISAs1 family transposase [Nonomuraea fuscirosea]|uniref:ISAs1 family transposase n=1 Tax=Nonomuraea fuscirosea TaxID=1291556 RepID=UPI0034245322